LDPRSASSEPGTRASISACQWPLGSGTLSRTGPGLSGNVAVAHVAAADTVAVRARAVSVALVVLLAGIAVGVFLRIAPVLGADFPLNDGGMFYAMMRDLQEAGCRLPLFTTYNGAGIPYTYPPLPFYLGAILDDLTPLSLFDVLRFLPALIATLTLGAFYLLARSVHASPLAVAASVATFALLPESFVWLVMGGGLTRSLGMLFALLGAREPIGCTRRTMGRRCRGSSSGRRSPSSVIWKPRRSSP
jgi:hypothetical protein